MNEDQRLNELGSETLFRHMANTAPVMIWISGEDKGCFWFNQPWLDFTGRSMAEECGAGWAENLHPEDVNRCMAVYSTAFDARQPFHMEYRLRRKDGEYRWLLDNGVPRFGEDGTFLGFIGSCVDITERIDAEMALQASEERLRMLVESATEYAIFTVSSGGSIETWSEGAERMFGYHDEEILGRAFDILFTPEDRAAGIPSRELEVARSVGRSFDDRWHVRKNGTRLFAAGAVSPIRGTKPVSFVKIARDLTNRKKMEDALKLADARKNEFIATLAHELRNPLAPIRTGLEILRTPGASDTMKENVLGIMERQMDQMVYLVNDLLEISRISQGKIQLKLETINIIKSLQLALASCQAEAESKQHRFVLSMPERPMWVRGDEVRLEQVFINLFNNAIKYTHHGGTIEVKAFAEDHHAVVKVKDNGIGIAPDMLTEIFEMFRQVSSQGQTSGSGLGIGLSVVKSMVEMHGGVIRATSDGADTGSEFTVRIPLVFDQSAMENEPPSEAPLSYDELPTARRILLVDDNLDAAETLKAILMGKGYKVHVAATGAAAIAEAEEFHPEICICDIGLPDMNGYEIARMLSLADPQILLISISGWGQESDRQRSREAGFSQHLVKPIKMEELWPLLEPTAV